MNKQYKEGMKAAKNGKSYLECPYRDHSIKYHDWQEGFLHEWLKNNSEEENEKHNL